MIAILTQEKNNANANILKGDEYLGTIILMRVAHVRIFLDIAIETPLSLHH